MAGFIHPKETILEYCRFCQRHNLHLCVYDIRFWGFESTLRVISNAVVYQTRFTLYRCTRTGVSLRIYWISHASLTLFQANTTSPSFQSILSIDVMKEAQCDPARVHVLYGYVHQHPRYSTRLLIWTCFSVCRKTSGPMASESVC